MSDSAITPEQIAAAEALLNLEFTPAQREQMLEIVTGRRNQYDGIRAADLDNSVPLSLNFNVAGQRSRARRYAANLSP